MLCLSCPHDYFKMDSLNLSVYSILQYLSIIIDIVKGIRLYKIVYVDSIQMYIQNDHNKYRHSRSNLSNL